MSQSSNDEIWYLDSGANDHYTNTDCHLLNHVDLPDPVQITIADVDKKLESRKHGVIRLLSCVNGKNINLRLRKVFYVPNLFCNLLSANKLDEAGCKIEICDRTAKIFFGEKLLAIGHAVGGLYRLEFRYVTDNSDNKALASVSGKMNTKLWHQRLAHPSNNVLKKMLNSKKLSKFEKFDELCKSCLEAKHAHFPFSNHFTLHSKRVLELVHSDVCGPISPYTFNDSRYFVSFINDFTHYACIYLITNKSEVLNCFKLFEAFATAVTGERIVFLRCDNGGEYKSTDLETFINKKGITVQCTAPHSSQQNGVAERFNHSLLEKVRAVLYESKLLKSFWGEAALYVTYTLNCVAHMHVPDATRSKLDKKSEVCAFVGYGENGYRL